MRRSKITEDGWDPLFIQPILYLHGNFLFFLSLQSANTSFLFLLQLYAKTITHPFLLSLSAVFLFLFFFIIYSHRPFYSFSVLPVANMAAIASHGSKLGQILPFVGCLVGEFILQQQHRWCRGTQVQARLFLMQNCLVADIFLLKHWLKFPIASLCKVLSMFHNGGCLNNNSSYDNFVREFTWYNM